MCQGCMCGCMVGWILSIRPLSTILVALDYPWLARTHERPARETPCAEASQEGKGRLGQAWASPRKCPEAA